MYVCMYDKVKWFFQPFEFYVLFRQSMAISVNTYINKIPRQFKMTMKNIVIQFNAILDLSFVNLSTLILNFGSPLNQIGDSYLHKTRQYIVLFNVAINWA